MINNEFHSNNFISIYNDRDARLLALLKCRPDNTLYVALVNEERDTVRIINLKDIFFQVWRYFDSDYYRNRDGVSTNPYLRGWPIYQDLMNNDSTVVRPFKLVSSIKNFEVNVATERVLLHAGYTQYPKPVVIDNGGEGEEEESSDLAEIDQDSFMLLDFEGDLVSEPVFRHDNESVWSSYPVRFLNPDVLMYVGDNILNHQALQFWNLRTGEHLQPGLPVIESVADTARVYNSMRSYVYHAGKRLLALHLQSWPDDTEEDDDNHSTGADGQAEFEDQNAWTGLCVYTVQIFKLKDNYGLTPLNNPGNAGFNVLDDFGMAINPQATELAVLSCKPTHRRGTNLPGAYIKTYSIDNLAVPTRHVAIDFAARAYDLHGIWYLDDDTVIVLHQQDIYVYHLLTGKIITKLNQDLRRVCHVTGNQLYFTYRNVLYVYDTVNGKQPKYPYQLSSSKSQQYRNRQAPPLTNVPVATPEERHQYRYSQRQVEDQHLANYALIALYLFIAVVIIFWLSLN